LFLISDQTKLIDVEEMAKTVAKGKWAADASDVSILHSRLLIAAFL